MGGGYRGGFLSWRVAAEAGIKASATFKARGCTFAAGENCRASAMADGIRRPHLHNPHKNEKDKLLVQGGVEDGDQEVRKMSGALVHLKPTNDAMVREILGDAGLGNAEMLGQLRLDGLTVAGRATE